MYRIVVTKILCESEYIPLFLNFYKCADKIHVFSSNNDIGNEFLRQGKDFLDIVIHSAPIYRNYKMEEIENEKIWRIILKEVKELGVDDIVVIFVDIDEYITSYNVNKGDLQPICNSYLENNWIIYRAVSIGRYPLNISLSIDSVKYQKDIIRYIENNFPIVYPENLWRDPIYKYPIIRIKEEYLKFLENITPSGGFHRWIYKRKKVVLLDSPIYLTNHIKAIDYPRAIAKLNYMIEKSDRDDWNYIHYKSLKDNIMSLYVDVRGSKINPEKISYENILLDAYSFDQKKSYFNNRIMVENIELPEGSKPHLKEV